MRSIIARAFRTSQGGLPIAVATVVLLGGCATGRKQAALDAPADWFAWQAKRQESLAGTNGWTTLVARHWLQQGTISAGAASTNQLVLPAGRAPACVGQFTREGQSVRFAAAPGVTALVGGQRVDQVQMVSDATNEPTRLMVGELSFTIIERGDRVGVRVRDPKAPGRVAFKGIDCFAYDPAWRLNGRFEAFPSAKVMKVQDAIGGTQDLISPGRIVFTHDGQEHDLDVVLETGEEDYFVIFRDKTAGVSTYGSGRFLYVARPGADGSVTIDFNRSYTPPCGYTAFAVCPLPPSQNWLPFAIEAGELKPRGSGEH